MSTCFKEKTIQLHFVCKYDEFSFNWHHVNSWKLLCLRFPTYKHNTFILNTFLCMSPSHRHDKMNKISDCISISTTSFSSVFCVNAVFKTPVDVYSFLEYLCYWVCLFHKTMIRNRADYTCVDFVSKYLDRLSSFNW